MLSVKNVLQIIYDPRSKTSQYSFSFSSFSVSPLSIHLLILFYLPIHLFIHGSVDFPSYLSLDSILSFHSFVYPWIGQPPELSISVYSIYLFICKECFDYYLRSA